jgi:hypothetical protein
MDLLLVMQRMFCEAGPCERFVNAGEHDDEQEAAAEDEAAFDGAQA